MFTKLREWATKKKIYNQTRTELWSLNDRELADLGITRGEIGRISHQAAARG